MGLDLDGEGFLQNRDDWTVDVAKEIAKLDGTEIDEQQMTWILEARKMYDENGVVPPIRKFSKAMKVTNKDLYDSFTKGPMKLICKWGGLPKPTGCV